MTEHVIAVGSDRANVLRVKCADVDLTEFEYNLKIYNTIFDSFFETLVYHKAVGLAANQVGIPKNFFVMNVNKKYVFVNPKIIGVAKGCSFLPEGCLSIPGVIKEKSRYLGVIVEYYDEECLFQTKTFTGLEAICIQHEMDHLAGKLMTDDN
jgi:peptide deformylase